MKAQAIINRFVHDGDPTPGASVTGVEQLGYVHSWHLWQEGETIDRQIESPSEWGKGEYPVNFEGLRGRVDSMTFEWDLNRDMPDTPICLEMEIGPSVYDLIDIPTGIDHVAHVGRVVGALGGVDCVYGQGWRTDRPLHTDLAAYALYGCPDRLAVPLYGGWSPDWGHDRRNRIERAKRLADAITFKPVRLALFISPYNDNRGGDMGLEEWDRVCVSTRQVCEYFDADVVMWWDGGQDRRPYSDAEPFVAVYREAFAGFEGVQ